MISLVLVYNLLLRNYWNTSFNSWLITDSIVPKKRTEYAIVNIQLLIYNCAKFQWCHLQNGE